MKRIFIGLCSAILFAGLGSLASAANMTINGTISDSACGSSHAKMTAGKKMTDRDCALACIKNGAKYVFVADGKVYNIANQNFAALQQYAGEHVSLTGDVSGETVTVSKLAAAAKK